MKRKYNSPLLMTLTPGEGPIIPIGPSQGTSGEVSQFSFSGIDDDTLDLIYLNCDDIDLADMDTNDDFVITLAEFEAWYEENLPW